MFGVLCLLWSESKTVSRFYCCSFQSLRQHVTAANMETYLTHSTGIQIHTSHTGIHINSTVDC